MKTLINLVLILAVTFLMGCGLDDWSKATDKPKRNIGAPVIGAKSQWQIGNYVDEFGDPTSKKYAYSVVTGVFSNTATTNSCLGVRIVVDFESGIDIGIVLFEYCTKHPVKNFHSEGTKYTVKFKSGDDKRTFPATNYGDRLRFTAAFENELHCVFEDATEVKFYIYEKDTPTTTYSFTISAIGYTAAINKIKPPPKEEKGE